MSVDFGKPQTAWLSAYGSKTKLTKQIRDKGFRLRTSLGVNDIYAIIAVTCQDYPVKSKRILGELRPLFRSTQQYQNAVFYGAVVSSKKDGTPYPLGPYWVIALAAGEGQDKAIRLYHAKLLSGKIQEVDELEHFLNELEQNLQDRDPHAEIALVA